MLSENCRFLRHLLFIYLVIASFRLSAQQLTHLQGEIMITLHAEEELNCFLNAHQVFNQQETRLQLVKKLKTAMPIYRLSFDFTKIEERSFLAKVKNDPRIAIAQFNHILETRNTPNDPYYINQWQYFNTTFPSADINAPLAWETSIGGTTFDGDTIVVCIIDDGMDMSHADFGDNLWVNTAEIPNNGIDEDGNGYVDDYKGWNVHEQSDLLQTSEDDGEHGTPIMGIIGAKGDNELGVSGINWNVKLMVVVGYNNEAEILEAYTYPHRLRKKFNESNGAEGALVVATNSSWGTAFGQAADAPLWCAFYDTLGQQGILSAGATINGNHNVDMVGDLPTTCASDYLISVTNLDYTGSKVNAAGYGPINIDLGAYGENVFTTLPNNSYGSFHGTSAATPQVAGAVALLYAAPCPSLASLTKIDPSFAAEIVKEYILLGTDPNASLFGLSQTGGSLNLKNSIDLIMSNCDFSDCAYPYGIEANNITDQSIQLNWSVPNIVNNSNVRYRKVGQAEWIELQQILSPSAITGLEACTDYEVQVKANCAAAASEYSESVHFRTEGCCLAPENFTVLNTTQTTAQLNWDTQYDVDSYLLRYRIKDSTEWIEVPTNTAFSLLIDLEACTNYEAKLEGICGNNTSTGFTEIINFSTLGCPNCIELDYCTISGSNDGNTWLSFIELNQLSNSSGFENGIYSDFTDLSTNLVQGEYQNVHLQTSYQFFEAPSYFSIWIDFNQNGEFEDIELVLNNTNPQLNFNGSIYIPSNAILGSTRMRVAARSSNTGPCDQVYESGEVEDYCISIIPPTGCIPPYFLSCAHTKTKSYLSWDCNVPVDSFGIRYRAKGEDSWLYVTTQNYYYTIEDLDPCTSYEYQIHSICGFVESGYSPLATFKTKGCGACLDYKYCPTNASNANFEWIESVSFDGIENLSQTNDGYGNYSNFIYNFKTEMPHSFSLQPGFANTADLEYFKIWIDLNQDGDFGDLGELIFDQLSPTLDFPVTGEFTLPATAKEGSTKMRITMKYNAAPVNACESNFSGEIEDYCINISHTQTDLCDYPSNLSISDFGMNYADLYWNASNANQVSYQLEFKASNKEQWHKIFTNKNSFHLSGLLECQDYEFRVGSICDLGLSQMSTPRSFETECTQVSTTNLERSSISVYPNPFEDYIDLELKEEFAKPVSILLVNTAGQIVYNAELESIYGSVRLSLDQSIPAGIYFLQIRTGNEQLIQKLVRQ